MKIHLGQTIQQIVIDKGLSVTEFSQMIGTSRSNAHNIFQREVLDTDLLAKISKVLDFNFFNLFENLSSVTATIVVHLDAGELESGNYKAAFCKNCPVNQGKITGENDQ